MEKKKTSITAIALILMLTISASLITNILVVFGQKIVVDVFVGVSPRIVMLGDSVLVNGFITPHPETWRKVYEGLYFVFTRPDGTTDTVGPITTELGPNESTGTGTTWFTYEPDKIGDWTVKLTWDGDDAHEGAESKPFEFTVQSELVPKMEPVPLPTGYWEHPISAENSEWYKISGGWYFSDKTANFNASCTSFNPYSKAPETAHVLWTHQPYIGGLVGGNYGGAYGESAFYSAHYYPSPFTAIMGGRVYYVSDDGIHCLDERTGEELWTPAIPIPGTSGGGTSMSYTAALWAVPEYTTYANRETAQLPLTTPVLWTISGRQIGGEEALAAAITKYDASRGAVLMILTPPEGQSFGKTYFVPSEHCAYSQMSSPTGTRLVKWDTIGTQRNFTERIIWDKPAPEKWYWFFGVCEDVLVSAHGWGLTPSGLTAVNATTGELLWDNHPIDGVLNMAGAMSYNKIYYPDSLHMTTHAFDLFTGDEIWESEPREAPWGPFTAYNEAVAYNKIYMQSYDGYIYAYNADTGKTEWKFYSGDTTETPYGTWPWWSGIAVADEKVYAGTSEHSPTPPFMKGCKLYCLDADTGDEIWSIAFANGGGKSIADGTLIATNEYDSTMYAFAKGQTATTVTGPDTVQSLGTPILIKGTITDQSPAQLGTPCVSDEDMTAWMEHLHMQKPCPEDVTGVQVKLAAVDSNGKTVEIGTVTSDAYGMFKKMWTPESEGEYTITATFEGTKSYWSSYAETAIGVGPAPSPDGQIQPEPEAPWLTTEVAIILAVVAVVVIGIVGYWALRKRQ